MPLKPGSDKKTIEQNTEDLIKSGHKPDQAYKIANDKARETSHKKGFLGAYGDKNPPKA